MGGYGVEAGRDVTLPSPLAKAAAEGKTAFGTQRGRLQEAAGRTALPDP